MIPEFLEPLIVRLYRRTGHCAMGKVHDALCHEILDKMGAPTTPPDSNARYGICGRLQAWFDCQPPSAHEIAKFLKEFDEGKHPLTPEDEKALEAGKARLMEKIRKTFKQPPTT